jgi:hypothetical protein
MRAQENRPAAARERGLQMFLAFQTRQLEDASIGAPPADRSFEHADAEAAEMLAQDLLALVDRKLRQAQLQIATGDAHEAERQSHQDTADAPSQPHQQRKRQRLEHAQNPEREPRWPVTRMDAHARYGSPSGPGRRKRLYVQRYCSG